MEDMAPTNILKKLQGAVLKMVSNKIIYWNSIIALTISAVWNVGFHVGDINITRVGLLSVISAISITYVIFSIVPIIGLLDSKNKKGS